MWKVFSIRIVREGVTCILVAQQRGWSLTNKGNCSSARKPKITLYLVFTSSQSAPSFVALRVLHKVICHTTYLFKAPLQQGYVNMIVSEWSMPKLIQFVMSLLLLDLVPVLKASVRLFIITYVMKYCLTVKGLWQPFLMKQLQFQLLNKLKKLYLWRLGLLETGSSLVIEFCRPKVIWIGPISRRRALKDSGTLRWPFVKIFLWHFEGQYTNIVIE